jgi:hypothetical protein
MPLVGIEQSGGNGGAAAGSLARGSPEDEAEADAAAAALADVASSSSSGGWAARWRRQGLSKRSMSRSLSKYVPLTEQVCPAH